MARDKLLIDTSILIDHLRKSQKDRTLFYQLSLRFDYVISVVTEFEFAVGFLCQQSPIWRSIVGTILYLTFDSACAQTAIHLNQQLKADNQLIAVPDLFIAATALTHDLTLLTLNHKHFSRITQLKLYPLGG